MLSWMLYGANGYTGELIAEEAARRGLRPVLAGRSEEKVRPLAERLGLEHRAFALDSPERIAAHLDGVDLMLLAAGPFSATSGPVVDACLAAGVHYLDITGEIPVFEACHRRDAEAKARGVIVMPGVGFDVVPSDCLAAALKRALPEADELEIAFATEEGPSAGTTKTIVENSPNGGAVRRNGRIERVPSAWRSKTIPFRDRPRHAVTIPWGDVATAYYSTAIPTITVYMAMPRMAGAFLTLTRPFGPVLGLGPVQSLLKAAAGRFVKGPDEHARQTSKCQLWGKASVGGSGRSVEGTLETIESYELTAQTALEIVRRVDEQDVAPGALTPSMAFGPELITAIEGCRMFVQ